MHLIFCNKGMAKPFRHVLNCLAEFSPETTIHVITDIPQHQPWLFEYPLSRYEGLPEVLSFRKHYRHLSTNPEDFERACLERWLIIPALMRELNLRECIVADWDMLFFCDLEKVTTQLRPMCDIAVSNGSSPAVSWWFSADILRDLAALIVGTYSGTDKRAAGEIFGHYDKLQAIGKNGSVCDMTFIDYVIRHKPYKVADTYNVVGDAIFDNNITITNEWAACDGMKQFEWRDGIPYCYNTRLKQKIRFNSIHCTGPAKELSDELLISSRRSRCLM